MGFSAAAARLVCPEVILANASIQLTVRAPRPTETLSPPSAVTSKGDRYMFPLTSYKITQTLGHGAPALLGRLARASAVTVGATAIALLAFTQTSADAAEDSSRVAQEHHACAVVLGLDPSGDRYDTCIMSLDRSLSEWDQERLARSDRSTCAQKGLQPGTPAFAVCVVKTGQSP